MIRCLACFLAAAVKSKSRLAAENLCLRQQLVILQWRQARPRVRDADRRFWVLACRWSSNWRDHLIIVKPDTVIRWHRIGGKAHWRRRSRRPGKAGRKPTDRETQRLIHRMALENPLWGQRRIQAEPALLGIRVCARTVAQYIRRRSTDCARTGHSASERVLAGPADGQSLRARYDSTSFLDPRA